MKMTLYEALCANRLCQNAIISVALVLGWSEQLETDLLALGDQELVLRNSLLGI